MEISAAALVGQLLIGLINGSALAMLSLGLAVIFGLLNIINVTHGAQYMMGAFCAWLLLTHFGIGYWPALIIAPVVVGITGIALERIFLRRVYKLDHIYGFLLTLGLSLLIEGAFRQRYGTSGQAYDIPDILVGGFELGFLYLPAYRVWIVVFSSAVCLGTWFVIERTRLGATLRAATENPAMTQAFGINVPRMVTLTYGFGVGLAALAGVMVAPIYQVGSLMGANILAVVFAVVVIGGLNSLLGAIIAGFSLGVIEGLTKVFYPEASSTVIFLVMVVVLLLKPAGLLGTIVQAAPSNLNLDTVPVRRIVVTVTTIALLVLAVAAPFLFYPLFVTQALCYALFALSFNLLLGYGGLMSFGQAAFFGSASYVMAYTVKSWGLSPELGILAGTASAAILGVVFGWIAIRRQGIYFAMITFALAQIVYFYAVQASWTEGENGIQAVPAGYLFGVFDLSNRYVVYYFILALFLFAFAVVWRVIHSPFGQVLNAIRQNEPRAISLGYKVDRHKLLAFTLSAALAGLAGSAKTAVFHLATLTDVEWTTSAQVVLITLVGGLGTMLGPVVGAFVIVAMQNYLAEFGSWVTVIQGAVFVACVLAFRQGIVGGALGLLGRWHPRPEPGSQTLRFERKTGDASTPELVVDQLDPDQRRVYDAIVAGPRGAVEGPLRVWLTSPELADRAQAFGAYCRFKTSLPARLSELALLVVGAFWRAGFEWHVHRPVGVAAGLDPVALEAIRLGREPQLPRSDEAAVYAFSRELLVARRVSPATYRRAVDRLGERGVVDLIGVLGYYGLVCMTIVAFEVPVPEGAPPPFPDASDAGSEIGTDRGVVSAAVRRSASRDFEDLMMPHQVRLIPTTVVGSYPQPDWLVNRDVLMSIRVPRVHAREIWRVAPEFLESAQDDATILAIRDMERAGIDIITDGEIRRESYSNRFALLLEGIDAEHPAETIGRTGLATPVPRVVGRIRRRTPVEIRDAQFLRDNTTGLTKITLPGPFTMTQQAHNDFYRDEEEMAMDYAIAVNEELRDLKRTGIDVVQLDEPWLQARPEQAMRYGLKALNRALLDIPGPTIIHLCFGYAQFVSSKPSGYSFLPQLADTCAEQISIEAAQPGLDLGVLKELGDKKIVLGVISLGTNRIETPEIVAQRIESALPFVAVERLIAAPDCGMKYLAREVAFGKLKALADGAALVRGRDR